MAKHDLGRLREAYAAAWEARWETGDVSDAVLINALEGSGLEAFSSPGPGRDLVLSLWEREVPPDAFEREFRREVRQALPGIAWTTLGSLAGSLVEIVRMLRGGDCERVDFSWQEPPEGYRKLSDVRQTNDLVLRWLHRPVDKIALEFRVDDGAEGAIERCRQAPSADRSGWAEAHCWLLPGDAPTAQVMVGRERIGWTRVPDHAWAELKEEQERQVFADGSVLLDHYGPGIELVCFLPRER